MDDVRDPVVDEYLHRMPPHSRDIEEAVLSAVMQDPVEAMPAALEMLSRPSFYIESHQMIWDAMERLHARGIAPGRAVLTAEMETLDRLADVGGETYLMRVEAAVPDASQVRTHCEVLREKKLKRDLLDEMRKVEDGIYSRGAPLELPDALDKIEAVTTKTAMALDKSEVVTGAQAVDACIEQGFYEYQDEDGRHRWAKVWGYPCGLKHLDFILHGFRRGGMSLVLSMPNVGKTMLLLNMANWFSSHEHPTLFFSLEQPRGEIGHRLLAIRSNVRDDDLSKEKGIDPKVMLEVKRAADDLREMPLYIDDRERLSLRAFKSEVRKAVRRHGVHVVMVDFVQLMDKSDMREEREDLRYSTIAYGMKALARELGIHIFIASQMNREAVKRSIEGTGPRLGDTKESAGLEEASDIVLGLWNPKLKKKEEDDDEAIKRASRLVNIRVLKNRHGPGKGLRADVSMLPGRAEMRAVLKSSDVDETDDLMNADPPPPEDAEPMDLDL